MGWQILNNYDVNLTSDSYSGTDWTNPPIYIGLADQNNNIVDWSNMPEDFDYDMLFVYAESQLDESSPDPKFQISGETSSDGKGYKLEMDLSGNNSFNERNFKIYLYNNDCTAVSENTSFNIKQAGDDPNNYTNFYTSGPGYPSEMLQGSLGWVLVYINENLTSIDDSGDYNTMYYNYQSLDYGIRNYIMTGWPDYSQGSSCIDTMKQFEYNIYSTEFSEQTLNRPSIFNCFICNHTGSYSSAFSILKTSALKSQHLQDQSTVLFVYRHPGYQQVTPDYGTHDLTLYYYRKLTLNITTQTNGGKIATLYKIF